MLDDLRFEEVLGRTCCKQEITAVAAAVCLHPERMKELWDFAILTLGERCGLWGMLTNPMRVF